MKLVTLLVASVFAFASTALAEKLPDRVNATGLETVSAVVLSGTLDASSPTWDRTFNNIDPPDPTCNRPSTDSGNNGQFYALHCIQVTDFNPIEVVVTAGGTTIGDTVMYLFCSPFDVLNPAANQVFSDDDDGDGLLSAFTLADNVVLTPGNTYDLVISTFSAGDSGDYTIQTSANVIECEPISVEASTWGAVKADYR